MDEIEPHWQNFRGTELGGLLTSLYGNPKPQINYPKPKRKEFTPTVPFSSSIAKPEARDPRTSTRRNVVVAVPKPKVSTRQQLAPVDLISRRKQNSVIRAELDDMRIRNTYYRPAHTKPIGEKEKEKLANIFSYKGGKGLPEELTNPVGETPDEYLQKKNEKERILRIREERNPEKYRNYKPILSDNEQLKEQIVSEINERREYIADMRHQGLPIRDEAKIKFEISQRVSELQKMEDDT